MQDKKEYKEPNIDPKLLKPYDPANTEDRIYSLWEESGFFNPDICIEKGATKPDAEPFSIILPPPNVTGTLHIGHASMLVIEDIMVRFARMQGKRTLWLPGTDHAAIATQSKVEKILEKEGIRKNDLGRVEFRKRVNTFAQESHDTIVNQVKKMGASVDWSREAFTLDEKRNLAVRTAFKKMYDDGLIYRGHRMVNWDPKGQTVISDDEIVYKEEKTKFYYLKYGPFTIGTARPETKFGDKYVVMHPNDARYAEYKHGDKLEVEWINGPIAATIIKDESIDMEFGSGVMTITPWHSNVDFEIAQKYKLDKEQIIDQYGKLLEVAGEFAGMKIKDARAKIIEKLESKGLVEKIEDYTHNVATAERTECIIEPQVMNQWFIDVNKKIADRENKSLKELMLEAVQSGNTSILPDRFEKVYFHWIENLRDWCISRQIWYGHRIPVWYDQNGKEYPQKKIKLYLARHGESEANAKNIFCGANDSPLTELGKEQARQLGKKLHNKKIDGIISSSMVRGRDTANIVAKELGIKTESIIEIVDLHEVKTELDGQPKTPEFPTLNSLIMSGRGESIQEIEDRANRVLEVLSSLEEGTYVVCAHNAFNACIQSRILGLKGEEIVKHWTKLSIVENGGYIEVTFLVNPIGDSLTQDPDTLDTWFSSGLWTFSTLGWPEQTNDLKNYHPTTVLETGYDILFFWVARMILMSTYLLGEVPFKTVYLHGLVRDGQGKKMSKSLGNIIDPLDMIAKYGADAVRMSLIIGTGPGNDSKMSEDKIKAYKHFANKLWNITRFILTYTEGMELDENFTDYTDADKVLIKERDEIIAEITKEIAEYKFYLAGEKLYAYTWTRLADVILEESRDILTEPTIEDASSIQRKNSRAQFLLSTLQITVKALHPFMPYVTEELWSIINPNAKNLLMVTEWPDLTKNKIND